MTVKTIGRRYPVFLTVLAATALYLLSDPFADYQVFDAMVALLSQLEALQAHEIIILSLVFVLGMAIDQTRNARRHRNQVQLDRARLRVLKVTMTSVHDIVNNALNSLVFIQIEAEKNQALSPETLQTFENIIAETADKLREINELDVIAERSFGAEISGLDLDNGRS